MMLIDASSIQAALRTLKADAAPILKDQTILDLTIYELGNIIWKETKEEMEAEKRAKALEKLLTIMQIYRINPNDITPITQNAIKHGLTFYDSAYLTIAQKTDTTLITEDQQLRSAAQKTGHPTKQIEKLTE